MKPRRVSPRYSIEQLLTAAGFTQSNSRDSNLLRFARAFGLDVAQVRRGRREGLTWHQADRWAVLCNTHPALIWPEWLGHSIEWAENLSRAEAYKMHQRDLKAAAA